HIRKILPARTRPGDTVVLFWSGHGGSFKDADGKINHFLEVHDSLPVTLPEKPSPEQLREAFDRLHQVLLTSRTLQRWLQELDGRRIILVADACHSGGLHAQGKFLLAPDQPDGLDDEPFLGDLLRRAKTLDQKDLALLAGCKADQVSLVRLEGDLSVL